MAIVTAVQQPPARRFLYGKYIFLYRHVITNQVIYSLSRDLHPRKALDQLPFYAKKTKPASIRRDHWRPYAAAEFHEPSQGQFAYRTLRELRFLRDYQWREHASREFMLLNKQARARRLMDQRGTSVVDLSVAIRKQNEFEERQAERRRETRDKKQAEWDARFDKVKELAKRAEEGELKEYIDKVELMKEERANLSGRNLERLDRALMLATKRRNKLQKAVDAMAVVRGETIPKSRWMRFGTRYKALLDTQRDMGHFWPLVEKMAQKGKEGGISAAKKEMAEISAKLNPQPLPTAETGSSEIELPSNAQVLPQLDRATRTALRDRLASVHEELRRYRCAQEAVTFTAGEYVPRVARSEWSTWLRQVVEGKIGEKGIIDERGVGQHPEAKNVVVHWADMHDLEFANEWPANVQHEWMGLLMGKRRFVAPRLWKGETAKWVDVSQLRASGWWDEFREAGADGGTQVELPVYDEVIDKDVEKVEMDLEKETAQAELGRIEEEEEKKGWLAGLGRKVGSVFSSKRP